MANNNQARKVINTIHREAKFEESSSVRYSYVQATRDSPMSRLYDLIELSFRAEDA